CSMAGSLEWLPQDRHEAELELAALDRLRYRGRRSVQLRIFRAVSDHAGFSMGESSALRHWRGAVALRSVPRIWTTAGLSRQDFRFDLHRDRFSSLRLLCLRNFLCAERSAALCTGAARRRKSSGLHVAGPKCKTRRPARSHFRKRRRSDFLPGTLVTPL